MTLASLPTLDVWVAFNPTASGYTLSTAQNATLPSSGYSNTYWTNISVYVREFATKAGRQHYLDRVEASTLRMTLNNRDGFFNGASPGGYKMDTRLPIAVQATVSGTAYPTFYGIINSVTEKLADALNSDLEIDASDLLQYLSQKYLHRPSFWQNYALSTSTQNWYRCSNYAVATVLSAQANSSAGTITYQIINSTVNFSTGQNVTVTGLAGLQTLNVTNASITSVTSSSGVVTSFTVNQATSSNPYSSSTGLAYITTMIDLKNGNNGTFDGQVSYPEHGVIIYDSNGCVDLSSSGNVPGGTLGLPKPSGVTNFGGIDFWMLGQQIGNNSLTFVNAGGSSANTLQLKVSPDGYIRVLLNGTVVSLSGTPKVNDGYWHHVGLVCDASGVPQLYCDGQFFAITSAPNYLTYLSNGILIGVNDYYAASFNGQIDEIVVSNTSSLSTLAGEVQKRYKAGLLLQQGFPVTSNKVYSADRIAEILTVAGFGSISGGSISALSTLSVPNYHVAQYDSSVGCSYRNYSLYNSASDKGYAAVEPYYWDSPVDNSTALDLIQQVTETDIGAFFQGPDGDFYFNPQNFYGNWAWTASTSSGSWTLGTATGISSPYLLTDSNSTSPYATGNGLAYDPTSLQVIKDDVDTWTTVRITPQSGTDQIYENTSAEARYGFTTLSKSSTVAISLSDALSAAYYLGYIYKDPIVRVNNVTLLSETANGANLPVMLTLWFGYVVRFNRTPINASPSPFYSQKMVVESISHEFHAEPGQWHTSLILDPYPVRA